MPMFLATIKQWLAAGGDVLLPRVCPVCHRPLGGDERWVCRQCLLRLPRTHYEETPFNAMEQLFAGKTPIERASAYFYYERGAPYAAIVHDIKYRHAPRMGQWLAARAVGEMRAAAAGSGDNCMFDGIEAVVPVPLHRSRLAKRGYNQCDYLARGIADATGAVVVHALKAVRSHATQTHKGVADRWQNIQDSYAATAAAAQLSGKHVLLVDDVVTTGATLTACATALHVAVADVRISVFTLAAARLS